MPDSPDIMLPPYSVWKDIYESMLVDPVLKGEDSHISFPYWSKIRKKAFPNVKIPCYTPLGKCDLCVTWKRERVLYQNSIEELSRISTQYEEHLKLVSRERGFYEDKKMAAKHQPTQYLSIVIDGMTTSHIPCVRPNTKHTQNVSLLKLNVVGLIDHGNFQRKIFYHLSHWKHDFNIVATILEEHFDSIRRTQGSLPPVLFLQVDNCFRENKNKYMFGFFASLVMKGYFKVVYIYFLPVGHTHIDVDQMFVGWSKRYFSSGLGSLLDVPDFVSAAFPFLDIQYHQQARKLPVLLIMSILFKALQM